MARILLVHADKNPWATQRRAEALKREWKDDEVDIVDRWNLPDGEPYDVIHFLFSGGITKCREYILRYKDKTFTTLASHRSLDEKWDKLEDLKEIYENTTVVCQSHELLVLLKKISNDIKAVYIPNGVDTEFFKRDFIVGYVGAKDSSTHKGLDMIQEACNDLGLTLKIAHNAPYEEMPDFYRSIDCLVLMSESEGCNNPTLEALAMNVPVISTETGIAKNLLVTIIERNKDELIKALITKCTSLHMKVEYGWPVIAKQYRKLYENLPTW